MTERESSEVERVLLHVGDARARAKRAAAELEKSGAQTHIIAALRDTEMQLDALHRKLSQRTYYAVPDAKLELAI